MAENPRYFYWSCTKDLIIGFLDIFNEFKVKRWDPETNNITNIIDAVPVIYGAMERSSFVEDDKVNRYLRLPMIHVDLKSMELDTKRTFSMKSHRNVDVIRDELRDEYPNAVYSNLYPSPYKFKFNVTVLAKFQEDIYQLLEQILPIWNFERVILVKHPVHKYILSNWAFMTSDASIDFNTDYSAEDRRGILSVPLSFEVEGWLTRDIVNENRMITDIISNYFINRTKEVTHELTGDPTIQKIVFNTLYGKELTSGDIITNGDINAEVISIGIDDDYEYNKIDHFVAPNRIVFTSNVPTWKPGESIFIENDINKGLFTISNNNAGDITLKENTIIGVTTTGYAYKMAYRHLQFPEIFNIERCIATDTIKLVETNNWKVGDIVEIKDHELNNGKYTIKKNKNGYITFDESLILEDVNVRGVCYLDNYKKSEGNYIIVKYDNIDKYFESGDEITFENMRKFEVSNSSPYNGQFYKEEITQINK